MQSSDNFMETKSWRTTTLGVLCFVLCAWLIYQGWEMHDWDLGDMSKFIYSLPMPFLAFATGVGLIHARDHKAK
jgi:uncharacterized membrane protein YphA (DoxX/SURF4 family)